MTDHHQEDDAPRRLAELLARVKTRGPATTDEEMRTHIRQLARQSEAQSAAMHLERRQLLANIPARYAAVTFDDWLAETPDQKRVKRYAESYATRFDELRTTGKSLLLMGGVGTGKSMLACVIGNAVLHRHQVEYRSVSEMHRLIRATYGKQATQSEVEVFDRLCSVPLLILDEICQSRGTEHEDQMLFDVIDRRYADTMPMLFATNGDGAAIRDRLGARLTDRIKEIATQLPMDWESHRGKKA
jgi:DNA replication protein DnaC